MNRFLVCIFLNTHFVFTGMIFVYITLALKEKEI